jgi:hypothetical protein
MDRDRKTKRLKILTWNAQSLNNKIFQFRHFLEKHKIQIACIQEASHNTKPPPKIVNYSLVHHNKLAIYVKKEINYTTIPNINNSPNLLTIKINNITISNFYNHPSQPINIQEISDLMNTTNQIIIGDFNARHTDWNNARTNTNGRKILNFLHNNPDKTLLYPQNSYTHYPANGNQPSTIDLILTNTKLYIEQPTTTNDLDSDHMPILTNVHLNKEFELQKQITKKTDWKKFKKDLQESIQIKPIRTNADIDATLQHATNCAIKAYNRHTTKTCTKPHQFILPPHILKLIQYKNTLRKTMQTYNLYCILRTKINNLNQTINHEIESHINTTWNNKLKNIDPKSNSYRKIVKALKSTQKNTSPLHTSQGLKFEDIDKANAIADELTKVQNLTNHLIDNKTHNKILNENRQFLTSNDNNSHPQLLTHTQLKSIIKKLPNKKAPGHDQITNEIIKQSPTSFTQCLTTILNKCMQNHYFPTTLKKSIVIPIPKPKKNPLYPQNYRPISLIPTIGKILEIIINLDLKSHTDKHNIIPDTQFGFRQYHSTIMQIARIINQITINTNLNKTTALTTIDLTKAFDTIWHDALINKLIHNKYPKHLIQIIFHYLQHRTFQVKYNKTLSDPHPITTGVPQGGVLSPQLYNIYTSDIPTDKTTEIALFADDTAIVTTSTQTKQSNKYTQRHLTLLENYYNTWRLVPNPEKSTITYFGKNRKRKNHTSTPSLYNQPIPETDTTKYLGLTIDKNLTFQKHIQQTIAKANTVRKKLHPLLNKKSKLNINTKTKIYKIYIRPIITYGCQIWSIANETNLKKLRTFENRILRDILDIKITDRISNKKIHDMTNCDPINEHIQKLNTNFYRHHIYASRLTESILSHPIENHYHKNQKLLTRIKINQ